MMTRSKDPPGGLVQIVSPPNETEPLPRLSRLQFWGCFAVLIAIFFFIGGPVWRHPFDVDDSAIYSYLPIPLLVAGCLLWSRRLKAVPLFLDSLELTLIKFGTTYVFATILWAASGSPPKPTPAPAAHVDRATQQEAPPVMPTPTVIDAAATGTITGAIVDAAGHPVSGAIVYIASGLDGYVFAPPPQPVHLENDGSGYVPRLSAVQTWQRIEARSTDEHLHTLVGMAQGATTLFNVPVIRAGTPNRVMIHEAHDHVSLRCSVHQKDAHEQVAELIVLSHPFFMTTGSDGRFRFEKVPAAQLHLAARHPERGETQADLTLSAGTSSEVSMALPR